MTSPTANKSGRVRTIALATFTASAGLAIVYLLLREAPSTPSIPSAVPMTPEETNAKPVMEPATPKPISIADSDQSPGLAEMTNKVKELADFGCSNLLHPPVVVKGTVAWTPRFPDEKNGACLVLLGATGDPNKILTGLVMTPDNQKIESPDSGADFEFVYCANAPGLYPINLTSPTNEKYTFAAVGCPRELAVKRIAETADK